MSLNCWSCLAISLSAFSLRRKPMWIAVEVCFHVLKALFMSSTSWRRRSAMSMLLTDSPLRVCERSDPAGDAPAAFASFSSLNRTTPTFSPYSPGTWGAGVGEARMSGRGGTSSGARPRQPMYAMARGTREYSCQLASVWRNALIASVGQFVGSPSAAPVARAATIVLRSRETSA